MRPPIEATLRVLAFILLLVATPLAAQNPAPAADGMGAQLAVDAAGTVRLVYGKRDTVFVKTSKDRGVSFGAPAVVGIIPRMYLGNTSGPVIASSKGRSLVAAIDRSGNMYLFQLDHASDVWTRAPRTLNDAPGAVPEGLMTLVADEADGFHAVWLDQRVTDRTEIFYARIPMLSPQMAAVPNVRIFASPSGSVCECCKPSAAVSGKNVAVMFRNSVDGFRDMYFLKSTDGGASFAPAQKLGQGSWKLNACPVDGGTIAFEANGNLATVWRRELTLFTTEAGGEETRIADGRSPMMSISSKGPAVVWQDGAQIMLRRPGAKTATAIGEGRLPQVLVLKDGSVLAAWEQTGKIFVRRVE